jgi:nucleoside-diphosphate-sugar epimerase
MENIPIPKVLSDAKLPCMYTPTVLQGFLALDDIAEVAVKVILNPREHAFARYELVGENRTLEEVATLMSEALGKKVEAFVTPRHEAVEKFSKEKGITTLNGKDNFERMLFYYDKRYADTSLAHTRADFFLCRGIPGNTNILRWLLGREPTTWKQLIERALAKQSS